jgi:hypothetical protein
LQTTFVATHYKLVGCSFFKNFNLIMYPGWESNPA